MVFDRVLSLFAGCLLQWLIVDSKESLFLLLSKFKMLLFCFGGTVAVTI